MGGPTAPGGASGGGGRRPRRKRGAGLASGRCTGLGGVAVTSNICTSLGEEVDDEERELGERTTLRAV